jgi:hypothetical protein
MLDLLVVYDRHGVLNETDVVRNIDRIRITSHQRDRSSNLGWTNQTC